jgi:ABC-type iron transport system FetAB ATPase subunit
MRLQVSGLRLELDGRLLYDDLSFGVGPGEVLVLRGPSGAGKSVLMRQLAWLHPVPVGDILLDGRPPMHWGVTDWRRRVTYVPQRPVLVMETPSAYARTIARLGVQRRRPAASPHGWSQAWGLADEVWDKRWSNLSGGEQQRLHLALALSREPDILLLDEPTSALDGETAARVEADLAARTCVWSTHNSDQAARIASHTVHLGGKRP